ncbi:uncharacterized protein EV422DRAFT_101825 [Fimicolochytrium jonesii]|uniref:uncharacterized protein n=1 Tax=Fimicolochytrium jonesii TaxID=1396493 RepID=UPI0022FE06FC|nr:uncharacterized protein EV422DRAFT_101825 [Fimicolochytrium jonesii]KAI8819663.1 hypothetical protein EV422DRAFT_101825 [Fimicolochytrium jonesii]
MEGLRIGTFPGELGRAAVATREFTVGELVLVDQPLLTVKAERTPSSESALLAKLQSILAEAREEIGSHAPEGAVVPLELQANIVAAYAGGLDDAERELVQTHFATPPSDEEHEVVIQILSTVASVIKQHTLSELEGISTEELTKLLLVFATNAHEYVEDGVLHIALYDVGSKLAHSCAPKTVYVGDGQLLKHYALQVIQKGDMVTTNYIIRDDIRACWPTHLRQQKLLATKFFHCRCERCLASDDFRLLKCPGCSESTLLLHPQQGTWICQHSPCSISIPHPSSASGATLPRHKNEPPLSQSLKEVLRFEQSLELSVTTATHEVESAHSQQTGKTSSGALQKLFIINATANQTLGTNHWITAWSSAYCAMRAEHLLRDRTRAAELAWNWVTWSEKRIKSVFPHLFARHLGSFGSLSVGADFEKRSGIARMWREVEPWMKEIFLGEMGVKKVRALGQQVRALREQDIQAEVQAPARPDQADWLPDALRLQASAGGQKAKSRRKRNR